MRRYLPGIIAATLLAGVAVAQSSFTFERLVKAFRGGIYIGATAERTSSNKVTRTLAPADQTIDFGSAAANTCVESSAITVTGALAADTCEIGPNATAGALGGSFTCYVSAADAVKGKFCNPTVGAIDPASGLFGLRVTSNK